MDKFKDKVAIVSGGASGIGRALCEEMARRGAIVIITDIDKEGADKVTENILSSGERAKSYYLDVTNSDDVQKLIDDTVGEYGRLDYMFNNAGIATLGEIRHMTAEQWQRIIDINLMGVLYGTVSAYSVMIKQGHGHIVNTSSHAGLHPVAGSTAYAMTKHGVVGLSTALRAEGAALGVKVSVICPGPIKTNIIDAATVVKLKKEFLSNMPTSMMMNADKAAKVMLKGIAGNKSIIICPFYARVLWWFFRFSPSLIYSMNKFGMKTFRKFSEDEQKN